MKNRETREALGERCASSDDLENGDDLRAQLQYDAAQNGKLFARLIGRECGVERSGVPAEHGELHRARRHRPGINSCRDEVRLAMIGAR